MKDYDILMVEDIGMLPVEKLANIMPTIKKKAKVIHVVHENRMCDHSWFYKIEWDKVVYFDKRQEFLKRIYPDAVHIDFPCYPSRRGDKKRARKKLKLPNNKKIILSFAHRGYHAYYRDLPPKLKRDCILLHLVPPDYQMLEELTPAPWRIIKKENIITTQKFDDYLFASDAAIFHKFQSRFYAVVSTTVYQALGTGCPIFVPRQSDFFHSVKNEVAHYSDIAALNKRLPELLYNKKKCDQLINRAERFVEEYSPDNIAKQFIDLFEKML
jgi:glycosyltransferase involved in cell wall biosynthesis